MTSGRSLRVATLNIWHDRGPWPDRLRLIRQEIERLRPDVIGLQEVLRHTVGADDESPPTPQTCQATRIAAELGLHVAYAAASGQEDAGQPGRVRHLGNAVLSRTPIRQERTFRLPGQPDAEPRALLFAVVDSDFGELPVFVTHLDWQPDHGWTRLAQVTFIRACIDEVAPMGGDLLPALLMGDFNAEPDSDEIRFLGSAPRNRPSASFVDAWVSGGDGSVGATFDQDNDYVREANEPSCRIDYIFTRPDPFGRGVAVHTELAFATPHPGQGGTRVWPSDHFGLVSDVVYARPDP